MAYATLADMVAAFGEDEMLVLADRDDDGVADPAVIESAQARAASLIESYLASRYAVPLATVPAAVAGRAADIQRYFLYDNEAPDRVKELFDAAVLWLRDAAAGKVQLNLPAPAGSPGGFAGSAGYLAPERVFSGSMLAGF